MSATAQPSADAVATGTTTGLALDEAALIALVKPGAVTKAAGSTAGSVDLSFSAASTAFDYLAKGEVLTLTYTVAIDDGDGGVTPKTFVVTVTGTNDAPVIGNIAQQNLTEQTDTKPLTATIPVTFTDVDLTDVGHYRESHPGGRDRHHHGPCARPGRADRAGDAGRGDQDAGSSSGSVALSFSAASTVFDYLAKDEVLTLTYTVAIDDGDGGVTSQTFVVTITGTNDAPVVATADVTGAVTEQVTPGRQPHRQRHHHASPTSTSPTFTVSARRLRRRRARHAHRRHEHRHHRHRPGGQLTWTYRSRPPRSSISPRTRPRSRASPSRSTTATAASSPQIDVTITGTNDAPVVAATDVTAR